MATHCLQSLPISERNAMQTMQMQRSGCRCMGDEQFRANKREALQRCFLRGGMVRKRKGGSGHRCQRYYDKSRRASAAQASPAQLTPMASTVEKHACETVEELQDMVAEEWEKLDRSALLTLADSMPARCKAVIAARGWHTMF